MQCCSCSLKSDCAVALEFVSKYSVLNEASLNWSRDVLFNVPIAGDFLLRKVIERCGENCLKRN